MKRCRCSKPHYAKGMCNTHYKAWWREREKQEKEERRASFSKASEKLVWREANGHELEQARRVYSNKPVKTVTLEAYYGGS